MGSPFLFKSTFYASILHRARCATRATAVSFGNQDVSYAELVRDIERATRRLAARRSNGTGLAMVSVAHPYLHWILTIALCGVGFCTVSALQAGHTPQLIQPDLIFADTRTEHADSRFVTVDQEWIAPDADKLPAFVDPEHMPDTPLRTTASWRPHSSSSW